MSQLTAPISAAEFRNGKALVRDVLTERRPDIDLSDGSALMGLLVENEAFMAAAHSANYDRLQKSFSLKAIADNLVDVDDSLVDSLVSNYFIERREASPASGPARIVVNLDVLIVLPADFTVEAGGVSYTTGRPVRVLRSGSLTTQTPNQRVLVPRVDGRFEFTVEVTATSPGAAGQISAGTVLTIPQPIEGMETASAATDFIGGDDRETNAELLERAQLGITAKTLAGPQHIQASLDEVFPGIQTSVTGIGSALMTRDRGNLFGVSSGATEDIWVKTTAFPGTESVEVSVTAPTSGRTMSFVLRGATAAGVYRVRFIRRADIAGIQGDVPDSVTPTKRSDIPFSPKTPTPQDLWFGAVSDLHVVFTDTSDAELVPGEDYTYTVEVFKMPTVSGVSNYAYDPAVRPAGTDYLVRAGVPCMLEVALEITTPAGQARPLAEDVQVVVAETVNASGFGVRGLTAYGIHSRLRDILGASGVANLTFRGTIYAPSEEIHIPLGLSIQIPELPGRGVGADNTFFAVSPSNVGVSFVS